MLEQVGESGLAPFLVFRTYAIPDIERDDRRFVVFVDEDSQPVREHELLIRDTDLLRKRV
jgi:hypothetical protein